MGDLPDRFFVIVSGLPGSGKSSVAGPLAEALHVPLLSKDVIKETLGDWLPVDDADASARIGAAAFEVLFALAEHAPAAVLESTWHREWHLERLRSFRRPIVEVFCSAPKDVCVERFLERREDERHPVHREQVMDEDDVVRSVLAWPEAQPLGAGPLVEVDTTGEVDVGAVAAAVAGALGATVRP